MICSGDCDNPHCYAKQENKMPRGIPNKKPGPKPLQIKSVSYDRRFNTGNYESRKIGAEAEVPPGESPSKVLARLAEWVQETHELGMEANFDESPQSGNRARRAMKMLDEYAREHELQSRGWAQAKELIKQLLDLD